jgi:ABC-type transporter lipoprotein component MlaA
MKRMQNWLMHSMRFIVPAALIVYCAVLPVPASGQESRKAAAIADNQPCDIHPAEGQMPYFDIVPDPIERVNRCTAGFNRGLFYGLIYPFNTAYAFVTPRPVRDSIANFGHNLAYPLRGLNSCLQGKWKGAWEETKRFGTNTTLGLLGFFDPATKFGIGKSDEDFGQTFGYYGSGPGFYLVLPLFGPSNGRDALGKILDSPFDIASAFFGASAFIAVNNLSMHNDDLYYLLKTSNDPYMLARTLWSINRETNVIDYVPVVNGKSNPDPSLGNVLFQARTPDFRSKAENRTLFWEQSGRKVTYSLWLQKKPAPLLVYLPGLGSHRLENSTLAFCDLFYRNGYSVATFSNIFNPEFMETASSSALPGDVTRDHDDVMRTMKAVIDDVCGSNECKVTSLLLGGTSYGAYMTLQTAAAVSQSRAYGLKFDRYIAVNPPLGLINALNKIDCLFNAPLKWPAETREQRIKETLYKAVSLAKGELTACSEIPLTREESQFLIGVVFRYQLVNVIQNSQMRHNLGVLKSDPSAFVRGPLYREVREISYSAYQQQFVLPYVEKTFGSQAQQKLMVSESIESLGPALASMRDKIVLQINDDDFLLSEQDRQWFRKLMGKRLIEYEHGGHLGNLHEEAVQKSLIKAATE